MGWVSPTNPPHFHTISTTMLPPGNATGNVARKAPRRDQPQMGGKQSQTPSLRGCLSNDPERSRHPSRAHRAFAVVHTYSLTIT